MAKAEHSSWKDLAQRPYPEHIYDPVRISVAKELIEKELLKQLPSLDSKARTVLRQDVDHWDDGSRIGLASIHDFWNGFDGITRGFKLKQFLPPLTARNVTWRRSKVPIKTITNTAQLPVMAPLGDPPYPVSKLQEALTDPKLQEQFREDSDRHSEYPVSRDHYPILLLDKGGLVRTLDGNRRVIRAAVYDRPTIDAWVGTIAKGKQPRDYWVTTGYLRNLVRFADEQQDDTVTDSVFTILKALMAETEIAKVNYRLRIMAPGSFGEALGHRLGLKK